MRIKVSKGDQRSQNFWDNNAVEDNTQNDKIENAAASVRPTRSSCHSIKCGVWSSKKWRTKQNGILNSLQLNLHVI
jgi:hypothetical protein